MIQKNMQTRDWMNVCISLHLEGFSYVTGSGLSLVYYNACLFLNFKLQNNSLLVFSKLEDFLWILGVSFQFDFMLWLFYSELPVIIFLLTNKKLFLLWVSVQSARKKPNKNVNHLSVFLVCLVLQLWADNDPPCIQSKSFPPFFYQFIVTEL